jgi:hypothetical protein
MDQARVAKRAHESTRPEPGTQDRQAEIADREGHQGEGLVLEQQAAVSEAGRVEVRARGEERELLRDDVARRAERERVARVAGELAVGGKRRRGDDRRGPTPIRRRLPLDDSGCR